MKKFIFPLILIIIIFIFNFIQEDKNINNKVSFDNNEFDYPNGTIIYFNPQIGIQCDNYVETNSLNENKEGCLKWYIFNDDKLADSVNMILDHNTTSLISWNTDISTNSEMKEVKDELDKLVTDFKWIISPRLIEANEIAKITRNKNFNGQVGEGFYFETNMSYRPKNYNKLYSWLYDYTYDCKKYGCSYLDSDTFGYWTSTKVSNNKNEAFGVYRDGSLDSSLIYFNNYLGVRPVITIDKSVIK